jgi:hypothetical protein
VCEFARRRVTQRARKTRRALGTKPTRAIQARICRVVCESFMASSAGIGVASFLR